MCGAWKLWKETIYYSSSLIQWKNIYLYLPQLVPVEQISWTKIHNDLFGKTICRAFTDKVIDNIILHLV